MRREVDPLSASDGEDDTQEVVIGLSMNGDSALAEPTAADSAPIATPDGDDATIDDAELEALFGEPGGAAHGPPPVVGHESAPVVSPYPDAPPSPPYPDARGPALDTTESAAVGALPVRKEPALVPAARPSRVPAVGSLEGDVMVLAEPAGGALVAPRKIGTLERRRRVKLQARRVRRIVRHVEPWSVMKMSIIFYACLWVILLVAGVVVWGAADSAGVIDSLEKQIRDYFVLDTFELNANEVFQGYAFGGLAFAIAGTAFNVLMCLLFNLISDLVGGLRVTMIEEETARPRPVRRVRRQRPTR